MDKKYTDGYKAALQTIAAKDRKQAQEINRILEGSLWGRLSKFFAKKQTKFEFKIVYNNPDMEFAETIRKTLCEQGHAAHALPLNHYRELPNNIADYTVFVNDCEQINRKNEKVILDQFGCFISILKHQIVIMCDAKKVDNNNIQDFIQYYDDKLSINQSLDKYAADKKIPESSNFAADSFETMIDHILQKADLIEKKQSAMQLMRLRWEMSLCWQEKDMKIIRKSKA